jgi:hypothetical protein
MRFAHSLGYPHCNLMLAELTSSQLAELYAFLNMEARERQQSSIEREEANIATFFDVAEARQKAGNGI